MKSETGFFVYILTNKNHTVFYTGMTARLEKRMWEHKNKLVDGFTKKYNCSKLIYYESGGDFYGALTREHQIKRYPRAWKENLIQEQNPFWRDLSEDFLE